MLLKGDTGDACMHKLTRLSLVLVMACYLLAARLLPEPMLPYCQVNNSEQISVKFESKLITNLSRKSPLHLEYLVCEMTTILLWPKCVNVQSLKRYMSAAIPGPFLLTWIVLIPEWISKHIPRKVWDEIAYPFPNFNGATVEVWEW